METPPPWVASVTARRYPAESERESLDLLTVAIPLADELTPLEGALDDTRQLIEVAAVGALDHVVPCATSHGLRRDRDLVDGGNDRVPQPVRPGNVESRDQGRSPIPAVSGPLRRSEPSQGGRSLARRLE